MTPEVIALIALVAIVIVGGCIVVFAGDWFVGWSVDRCLGDQLTIRPPGPHGVRDLRYPRQFRLGGLHRLFDPLDSDELDYVTTADWTFHRALRASEDPRTLSLISM